MFDLLVRGATVYDGVSEPRVTDVAVEGDRIAAVEALPHAPAKRVLEAHGQALAPGFIDVHNHSDGWLLRERNLACKTTQGFTTEIVASDGISYAPLTPELAPDWLVYLRPLNGLRVHDYTGWQTLADYIQLLDRRSASHAAVQIPYANLRVMACGWGPAPADDTQILQMQAAVREGMQCGAVALSTGLDYISQCHAPTDEITQVCQAMAPYDGLYVTHVRYKKGLLPALREAADICRRAEVKLHISHLKLEQGMPPERLLEFLDRELADVDYSFEMYPYGAGSTLLASLLPYEAWWDGPVAVAGKLRSKEMRRQWDILLANYRSSMDHVRIAWTATRDNADCRGLTLREFIDRRGGSPADALADLLIEEQLAVLMVVDSGGDDLAEPLISHPRAMIGSDGIWFPDGQVHPRVYGTTGKLLGRWVRGGVLSLTDAVRKLSSYPAERFCLTGRGIIRPGAAADLVLFDPATVIDRSEFTDPHQACDGIGEVIVGGVSVVTAGKAVMDLPDPLPGRALRRGV